MSVQLISGNLNFRQAENVTKPANLENNNLQKNDIVLEKQPEVDTFENTNVPENLEELKQPQNISMLRLATHYLTDEQIAEINETKRLPENAKFVANGYGQYYITYNAFNLRAGTQILPEGYEVKKNAFGQAIVVAKGTEGLLIK